MKILQSCKVTEEKCFSFYCKIPNVVKYRNVARENMKVTVEVLRNSHIGLITASRDYHLRKDT